MTNAPADLLGFRRQMRAATGLAADEDIGIVGDGRHARTGGYHEGEDVLVLIGRYHGPATAHIGSTAEDYSARLARDRRGLTDDASAVDIAAAWPRGGRVAWLRFNTLLIAALRGGDPALTAIRAVNYSPDGSARKRIDRQTGWSVESSSDSVTTHTHIEFYRDTVARRVAALTRLVELAQQAISGGSVTSTDTTGLTANISLAIFDGGSSCGRQVPFGTGQSNSLVAKLDYALDILDQLRNPATTHPPTDVTITVDPAVLNRAVVAALAPVTEQLTALIARLSAAGHALAE